MVWPAALRDSRGKAALAPTMTAAIETTSQPTTARARARASGIRERVDLCRVQGGEVPGAIGSGGAIGCPV